MAQPFIWIGVHKIKDGKAEKLKEILTKLATLIEEMEPRLLAFNFYLNEEETRVAVVQIHPDTDSFEFHMKVALEHISESYQYLEETESTQVFGSPSPAVLEMVEGIRKGAGQEETLRVMSRHLSGFSRLGDG